MSTWCISADAASRRSTLLSATRSALAKRGFVEVTTPVLLRHRNTGPAPMQPFQYAGVTYDLRTSIELLLRDALIEIPKVYDIGPAIRFEDCGRAPRSAIEFTLMECFTRSITYDDLTNLAEQLLHEVVPTLPAKARRINVAEWFAESMGIDLASMRASEIRAILAKTETEVDDGRPLWQLMNKSIEKGLESGLDGYVLLTDYPAQTICLANRRADAPHVVERFEIFINGLEVGHGFVDALDPEDVLARMVENGNQFVDQLLVDRLTRGEMPPSGGFGIGIERLLMSTDTPISDVRNYMHGYQHDH
jgi:lysyl-tRNA synthetase class 2